MENFDAWITRKYVEWRGDKVGRGGSVSAFARWVGVDQSSMTYWMSGGKKPESAKSINALVSRFGGEVYDVLGITPAEAIEFAVDDLTAAIAEAGHTTALLESLNRLEAEAADLRSQIAAIDHQLAAPIPELPAEDLPAQLERLRANLADPDLETAQRLLRGLVNRIIIDRDGPLVRGELIYYSPPP